MILHVEVDLHFVPDGHSVVEEVVQDGLLPHR